MAALSTGFLLACVAAPTSPLQAQHSAADRPAVWLVTLGVSATVGPRFEGSGDDELGWRPIIGFRRSDSRDWLAMPNDGIDIELFETDRFRAGPVAALRFNRDTDRSPRGFERIGGRDGVNVGVEAGVFAEYWPLEAFRTRVELREAVVGGSGLIADVSADLVWRPGPWTVAGGPRLAVADDRYVRERFGVAQQQATPGLAVHDTSAGVTGLGAGAMVTYAWSERWKTRAFVEYERLVGDAGSSPLVEDRDQLRFGLGTSVTFGLGR